MTISKDAVEAAWQDLIEKTDRTSPEEYPDMALITREELADYMHPAPSQSDEALLSGVLGLAQMYKTLGTAAQHEDAAQIASAIKEKIDAHLAAVRAEATLAGAAAEREACAKVADGFDFEFNDCAEKIAAAIRARK